MQENYEDYFEANKELWNERTMVHKDSAFYDLEGFKQGKSSLNQIELHEVGDVKGKTILHLQCHFGMDTMSWAREGALVTGVDISDEAIGLAKNISQELQLNAEFTCCNIYDLASQHDKKYDIVFTSYGTIGWLPDLNKWAEVVNHFLRPGGVFYIIDFHPVLWMMDDDLQFIKYNYFNKNVISEASNGTYADRDAAIRSKEYSWNHPLSDIFSALLRNGLQISSFHEFPYSPYNCFNNLEQGDDKMWRIREMDEKIPMMYSIKAFKQL